MAPKRTCGRYVTPFNCIFGDLVWLFRWFRRFRSAAPVVSVVPVVPMVSFRRFRFGVSGFSTLVQIPNASQGSFSCKIQGF